MTLADIEETGCQLNALLTVCQRAIECDGPDFQNDADCVARTLKDARDLVGHIIDAADILLRPRKPMAAKGSAQDLYSRWKAIREATKALAARTTVEGAPEVEAMNAEDERLSQLIAACQPQSDADAAAMLQWTVEDTKLQIISPEYEKAILAVSHYLHSKDARGSLSQVEAA